MSRELERGVYVAVLEDDGASVVRYYPDPKVVAPVDRRDFIKQAGAAAAAPIVAPIADIVTPDPEPPTPEPVAAVPVAGPVVAAPMTGLVLDQFDEQWTTN